MLRIVLEDGLTMVMDDQNDGYDCLDLGDCSIEYATAQIDRWAAEHEIDVAEAKRDLAAYFDELAAE